MTSFAIFKLPGTQECTLFLKRHGMPERIPSFKGLNSETGFIIAPFRISEQNPLLLIEPEQQYVYNCVSDIDENVIKELNKCALGNAAVSQKVNTDENVRAEYSDVFNLFHSKLLQGEFSKIVLARISDVHFETASLFDLFKKACETYQRMYVSFFSAPACGTWLVSTPELLLERSGNIYKTIALAGTMKALGKDDASAMPWSDKNYDEQRVVADYIYKCVENFSDDISEVGPSTVKAADLVHLSSDFCFSLRDNCLVGDLIAELHPTPAVCGMPKSRTMETIIGNEACAREYYSGFSGPMMRGTGTHLYVSLRCMQVFKKFFRLYAGGGLMPGSTENNEWRETEAKLETMKRIIGY